MSAGEIIAVLDAGPLIHLDELGSLSLLAGYNLAHLGELAAPFSSGMIFGGLSQLHISLQPGGQKADG